MSGTLKILLLIAVLGAIGWFGYRFLFPADQGLDPLLVDSGLGQSQAAIDGQLFLLRLQELRAIQFDASIFSDPRFRALVDERPEIVDEPFGRSNPFAPVN